MCRRSRLYSFYLSSILLSSSLLPFLVNSKHVIPFMSRHLTTFFPRPLSRMHPSFPHRKEGDVEKKECRQRERERRDFWQGSAVRVRLWCQNIFKRRLFVWLSPCCQSDWHSDRRGGGGGPGNIRLHQTQQRCMHYFISVGAGFFFQARGAFSWCKCWITVSVQGNSILTQIIPGGGNSARRCDSTTCWPEHA